MKTILRFSVACTILLLACNAWAQNRPECTTITNQYGVPMPQPPDRGVCFYSPEPGSPMAKTMFFVNDGENLVLILSDGLGENNFTRLDPKLLGKYHAHDMDGVTAHVCSQDYAVCWKDLILYAGGTPLPNYWFIGPGELTVNGASTGMNLRCPWTLRFSGTVTANDESGMEYKLQAFSTAVIDHNPPNPNAVCRAAMIKISIEPID